jgi:hypothetical protein
VSLPGRRRPFPPYRIFYREALEDIVAFRANQPIRLL